MVSLTDKLIHRVFKNQKDLNEILITSNWMGRAVSVFSVVTPLFAFLGGLYASYASFHDVNDETLVYLYLSKN